MRSGAAEPEVPSGQTVDAFHRGRFWLAQPAGKSHRAGVDAMLLAAAVPQKFSGGLADLGAGAGAAGLAVAARCPDARIALVEASPEMAEFARRSIALAENRHLGGRAKVVEADVTLTGKARHEAGLADAAFDFAIMNPPFNTAIDRRSPHALKSLAHVMGDGLFESWIRTAAAIVKPRGRLALIARPASLRAVLDAVESRFGSVEIMPIHPRVEAQAIRIVLRATKGSRGAPALLPALVLHDREGHALAERADAICNGEAPLFSD